MQFLFIGSELCPSELIVSPWHPTSFSIYLTMDTFAFG